MGSRCGSPAWQEQDIPPIELEAFDQRLSREPMDIEHLRWLTGGFSGSPVALVLVKRRGKAPTQAILKFCRKGKDEAQGIESAHSSAPADFQAHMVKPLRSFILHDWAAVLMKVAGGDLSSYKPIAEFSDKQELVSVCTAVIRSLLKEWNANTIHEIHDIESGEFFEKVIGEDRLDETGNLIRFPGPSRNESWIRRDIQPNELLVNPLTLINSRAGTKINALIGFGHGDLSVHNVLVPTWPRLKPDGFLLIDYGSFGHEYPLARDPMYLLVSLATQWLRDTRLPSSRSHALLRELARAGPPAPDLGLADYREVIDTIFDTGRKWAAKQAAMGGDWPSQSFLALAGVALTFIGRKIPGLESAAVDDWLFDLAAVVAKEHLADYAPAGGALPAPPRHAVPDGMLRAQPVDHAGPVVPILPPPAELSQLDAEPVAERSAEGRGTHADRPDQHTAELEGTLARLQEQVTTVGPLPAPPLRGGGTSRWLVSVGYWTDTAALVVSEIASFTYAHCNDPPDRFAQVVHDARSAIRTIVTQLPAATTTDDATMLANWAAYLWSVVVQLLPLSMEACDLGHALLAANDQVIPTTLPGAPPRPSGIPEDPGLGTLTVSLDATRSAVRPVVDIFLRQRPADDAADLLLDRLDALFKLLDKTYLPQSEGGQWVNLERVRDAVRSAAIALSRLIGSALSNDELSVVHKDLSQLLRVLDDILPSSEGE